MTNEIYSCYFYHKINLIKKFYTTNLNYACIVGDIAKIKELIALGVDVNLRDSLGRTPIMYAAVNGNIAIITCLIENKAIFITPRDLMGRTALWFAAYKGNIDCVRLLLINGARMIADVNLISPLWIAAAIGHIKVVQFLIKHAKLGIFSNLKGVNVLQIALIRENYKIYHLIEAYLIDRQANYNASITHSMDPTSNHDFKGMMLHQFKFKLKSTHDCHNALQDLKQDKVTSDLTQKIANPTKALKKLAIKFMKS